MHGGTKTGCDNPKKVVIPTDIKELGTIKDKVAKLSDEDKSLLTAYLMRASLGKAFGGDGMPSGTTVGDAIDAQSSGSRNRTTRPLQLRR